MKHSGQVLRFDTLLMVLLGCIADAKPSRDEEGKANNQLALRMGSLILLACSPLIPALPSAQR